MKMTKKTLALAVAAASVLTSAPAMADLSGNVAATSNYLWRGVTQSADTAAVQGGVDYTAGGFYAGAWASSLSTVAADYETDLYAGYKFEAAGLSFDVGVIDYVYPLETAGYDDSFAEAYVGVAYGALSAKVSHSPDVILAKGADDEAATYVEAAYAIEVGQKSSLGLHVGNYSGDGAKTLFGETYTDYSVSVSKEAFTFGVSKTTLENDDPRVFVTYKTSLGL